MRPEVDAVLARLLAIDPNEISLDSIGEAIGAMRIGQDEIEALLTELERAGRRLGEATPRVRQNLRPVLEQARRIRETSGTTPSVSALADATSLTVSEVRAALLYASVLGR